jgi:ATP-binding cassette subfamily C protein LapB
MVNSNTPPVQMDSLLNTLLLFCKVYHQARSVEYITEGLPVEPSGNLELFSLDKAKGLFSRAADRAGLATSLVERPLDKISPLQLPIILLLKDEQTCILDSFSSDKKQAKIILSAEDANEQWVDIDVLTSQYLGFSFLLKKKYAYDEPEKRTLKLEKKHWFWSSIRYSKLLYQDVFSASLLVNLFVLATPLFTMNVYDRVIPNNAMETLHVFAIGVILVYVLDVFLKFTRTHLLEKAAKKSDVIISSVLFEKVLGLKMANVPRSVGSFASSLKDFDSIRAFLTNSTMTALIDLPFSVLFLAVIFYIGGIIVLVPLTIMLMILIYALMKRKPLYNQIASSHQASAKKNSILIESLQNIETIKTQGREGQTQWLWEEACGEIATKALKTRKMTAAITTVTSFLVQLNTVFIIIIGVYLIQDLSLTMGGLIATMILSSRCVAPMGQAATLISSYEDAKASFTLLDDLMKQPSERSSEKDFIKLENIKGKIEFKDVSFTYPDADLPALKNVSFTIEAGERVAILGRIGSGKSTIEKLILQLYEPDKGNIFIDGIDINQLDPAQLRQNTGYVSQDIQLLKGTLKDNILGRATHVSDQQLLDAAQLSGTAEFAHKHPKGYQMPVDERGSGLSGGQRQCVGIARAFLLNPTIVLLDEPSSNLDQSSESELITRLQQNLPGKTTLLITHKLNLLALVEKIIVIKDGQVYLSGKKQQVLDHLSKPSTPSHSQAKVSEGNNV